MCTPATPWNWTNSNWVNSKREENTKFDGQGESQSPLFILCGDTRCRRIRPEGASANSPALQRREIRKNETGFSANCSGAEVAFSAEETDLRVSRNHRACDDHYDDHNREFHIASQPRLHEQKRQCSAYVVLPRTQGYESGEHGMECRVQRRKTLHRKISRKLRRRYRQKPRQ
jgi:hypothetical protein